jgi:hypothetical protein
MRSFVTVGKLAQGGHGGVAAELIGTVVVHVVDQRSMSFSDSNS